MLAMIPIYPHARWGCTEVVEQDVLGAQVVLTNVGERSGPLP